MQVDHKERPFLMVVFGAIEILIGLFWLLPGFAALRPVAGTIPPSSLALMVATFGGVGALSLALGIGTLLSRRWARTLSLLVAWFWLAGGLVVLVYSLVAPSIPGPVLAVFVFITLLSTAFVLFFSSKNVTAIFEARDPHVRWTDKCPAPVLVLSLTNALGVLGGIFSIVQAAPTPFFGTVLTGGAAQAYYTVLVALSAYLAWGMYKVARSAWWVAVIMTLVLGVSAAVSYSLLDTDTLYRAMNVPPQQVAALRMSGVGIGHLRQFTTVAMTLWLGYLLYVKRYFDAPAPRHA